MTLHKVDMASTIVLQPLTAAAFAPFGAVIETPGPRVFTINDGRCLRHDTLARVQTDDRPAAISIFVSQMVTLPFRLSTLERHPLGSQAFVPMSVDQRWFITVAPDADGTPGAPLAFSVGPGQGVSLDPGIWHGSLTPLNGPGRFAVIDRAGPDNLQEHALASPLEVLAG